MDFSDLINQLIGVMVLALTTLVTVLVPVLALYLKKKWGLEVDEKQRAQLVSAINNGIAYGAERAKSEFMPPTQAAHEKLEAAKDYVQEMAPAALKYFHLNTDPGKLEKKILSQITPSAAADAVAMIVPTPEGKKPK